MVLVGECREGEVVVLFGAVRVGSGGEGVVLCGLNGEALWVVACELSGAYAVGMW